MKKNNTEDSNQEKKSMFSKEGEKFFKGLNDQTFKTDKNIESFKADIDKNLVMSGQEISDDVGAFLSFLVRILKPKKVFEFGTFAGYSSLIIARELPEEATILTVDVNDKPVEIGRKYWEKENLEDKIQFIKGKGGEVLDQIDEKFDFVFIDADKKGTWEYFEKSLDKLNESGVILVDNIWLNGAIINPSREMHFARIEFLKKVKKRENITKTYITIGDGLLLVRKKQ